MDMSCAHKSKRNQLLQWNTNSPAESVGSLSLAKNAKHSPSNNNWRAGASQPSRTTGYIFIYNNYIYYI